MKNSSTLGLVGVLLAASASLAQAGVPFPISGKDLLRGDFAGVLDVTPVAPGTLRAELLLTFDRGGSRRLLGDLVRQQADVYRGPAREPGSQGDYELRVELNAGAMLCRGTYQGRFRFGRFQENVPLPILDQRHIQPIPPGDPAYGDTVQMRYLGNAGYHVKRGNDELLFGPFFSNPSFLQAALFRIQPDPVRIDRGLAPVPGARAILVGHGHYDHLMDVPYLARNQASNALIYTNRTSKNILAGDQGLDPARVVEVNGLAGDVTTPGAWIPVPGTRIRLMALKHDHADHFPPSIRFYEGRVDQPLSELPRRSNGWKLGETFAFLVDFLDGQGRPVFRIYYQDASAPAPNGFVAPSVLAERRVDVAIYCASLNMLVSGHPADLTRHLDPRLVVLGHWEEIFAPVDQLPLRLNIFTDIPRSIQEINHVRSPDTRWLMPLPGSLYHLR